MPASASKLPRYAQLYLEALPLHRPDASVEKERKTYETLYRSIARERNSRLRQLMNERLELYCRAFSASNPVLLSYIHAETWDDDTSEDRKLLALLNVYVPLEEILSQHFDRTSRYPLSVPSAVGTFAKMGITTLHEWTPKEFLGSYYDFGWQKLHIGEAISHMLQFLEEQYGLDFSELEKNRRRKVPS